jgi:UDP-N-acetylmuramoyl-tripeptide--D-alanyl-D-alanine ligase
MRYRWRDVPRLFATGAGRIQLRTALAYRLWPLLAPIAQAYRRTLARRTRVVAVVGSFGKSTTTGAVSALLGAPAPSPLTHNSWSAVALAVLRIRRDQPHAVIEVGISAPGQMAPYARVVRPDIVVVTSIASEHSRSFATLEATRAEKVRMVRALSPSGVAILNGDDPNVAWMAGETRARIVTFGFGAACTVRGAGFRLDWPAGSRFRVRAFGEEREVAVRLLGRHLAYAALAAIAAARVEGVPLDAAVAALRAVAPTRGRLEPVPLPNGAIVLRDDCKSGLETMHAALDVLAGIPARRRIVVFGDVSEPPSGQRPMYRHLGARVAEVAAHLVVVGRALERYATGARGRGMAREAIHDGGRDPRHAAQVLCALLEPGDVVLLKGRGTQKLDRVRLILEGRKVGCAIAFCSMRGTDCDGCPMLESGWGTHRIVMERARADRDPVNSGRSAASTARRADPQRRPASE